MNARIIKQYAIKELAPIPKAAITVHVILDGQDVTAIMKLTKCRTIPNICKHGTCKNTRGSYQCTCQTGWTGYNCSEDVNECNYHICAHGGCKNTQGGYQCTCYSGWTGRNCSADVNECSIRNICNHGTCINAQGSYRCLCLKGWKGRNCTDDVN